VHRKKVEIFHFRTYQCHEKAQIKIFSPWEKVEIFHFLTYQCQEKAQIDIFSPWEKVEIFYFLATSSRKKSNSQFFRLSYEHPPYLNDYAETAPFEASKHTSF
jgi:hypothetical protein